MHAVPHNVVMLAIFNLGGGEIILILAIVLILFGAGKLPPLARGLGHGLFMFHKSAKDALDEQASDAGRSLGGIYGGPAFQAVTPDNQVAELYNPDRGKEITRPLGAFRDLWNRVLKFLAWLCAKLVRPRE
jgi:TatA/E family protein of Tat protein translocase